MARISADQPWFTFVIEGGPQFRVYELEGSERLNEPYEFTLELVSIDANVDLIDLLGRQALLTMIDHGGQKRLIHGTIRQATQLYTGNIFTHYKVVMVPRLWYLGLNQNHRIFQNMNIVAIMEHIFKEQGFPSELVAFKLKEKYAPREYCVQYAESDLYFISRLCEEEGLYFYFEHQQDKHILCFSDASGGPWIPGQPDGLVRFYAGSGQLADEAVINRVRWGRQVRSDRATYREWNFQTPSIDLEATADEPAQQKAPAPGGLKLETYQFPHLYDNPGEGDRYADLRLKRQLTFSRWLEGRSDMTRLLPGFAFNLFGHAVQDANSSWWLTKVEHKGSQPQVLEHEAPDRGFHYHNEFTAIDFSTRFVPAEKHPKKRIDGLQSALITGPAGEEIYVDEYGRVKVKFHWDRLGPDNEKSTCWLRVAGFLAGENFGSIHCPRIGQEVLVEFMEGDPDRPVVTGRVHNADNMPIWDLPSQSALSGLQSRELFSDKRNELIMDDTPSQIQVQAASDHQHSQLNLGYITRVAHIKGRQEFRGEGFELRTDGWGAMRAARGLLLSSDPRNQASSYHKSMPEAVDGLGFFTSQQRGYLEEAAHHEAEPDEPEEIAETLETQFDEITGPEGADQAEMSAPHMVLSGPAGLAMTTDKSAHFSAGHNLAFSAGKNISLATGQSVVASALRRVSLFALKLGLKIFAGKGKLEIQAQSDDLDIIAKNVFKIISASGKVQFSAAKEILLTAGGSYLKIDKSGVESGTDGQFQSLAATHSLKGPKTMPVQAVTMARAAHLAQPICEDCEKRARQMKENKPEGGLIDQGLVTGIAGPLGQSGGPNPAQQKTDDSGVIWL
ncbi:type VI secretion system tip protein VgrG [Deltaproteobacteria bacterium Smac51]|nr:type VI secretion system tip protein VgrG [Deltaproteobacteria bacterium Smac51]